MNTSIRSEYGRPTPAGSPVNQLIRSIFLLLTVILTAVCYSVSWLLPAAVVGTVLLAAYGLLWFVPRIVARCRRQ